MNSLATAFTTIRRSPYQSLVVTLIVAAIAFVAYSVLLLTFFAGQLLNYVQTQPQVIAFFQLKTPIETINQLENEFRSLPEVKSVTVINQDQALEIYREENRDEPLLLELVTADILPASIEIQAHNLQGLESIKQILAKTDFVEEVVFQQDMIDRIKHITEFIKTWGAVYIAVLAAGCFLSTSVIIALKASNQRHKINVLRLLGASKSFVKLPFVFEGAFYGFFGSLLGFIAFCATVLSIWPNISTSVNSFVPSSILPIILIQQLGIGSLVSLVIGGGAGLIAITRLIKK